MITTLAATATAVLILARLAILLALHLVPSGYNAVEHAVSDYHVGPTRRLAVVMTWLTAASWATLAVCFLTGFGPEGERMPILVQLAGLVVIFIVLPFLPTTLEGQKLDLVGALHYVAAIAWFALAYSLTGNLVRAIGDSSALAAPLQVLHVVALVALVVLIAALLVKRARRHVFGLAERVFLVAISLFYLVASVAIILR
ncbi:DUF998 domain-containing protein [Arthrobacter sp.]|uniref:DUF998 domain-containing protein n=1 Tax=Arthrobacter sp. TaxID=1667 RepID=UPI003A9192DF